MGKRSRRLAHHVGHRAPAVKRLFKGLIALGFLGSLVGCTGLDVLNALTASPSSEAVVVSYGASARQKIDIYPQPKGNPHSRPMVVFFYGGSWATGSRTDYAFVARGFGEAGYVVAIVDYRLTPEVTYPGFVKDSAAAVKLLIDRAEEFGADPSKIVLAGHSAGAYNALMVAMDERWLEAGYRKRIRGVIGLSSPVNFLPIQMPEARLAFNWPNTPRDTQPIEHVRDDNPPILLLSANRDPLVNPAVNSRPMAQRLREKGVPVELYEFDGPMGIINHANLVATLSPSFRFAAPTLEKSIDFIQRVTR
jgi:acetyl esterase/lipase